jgi:hypothetical protein
MDIQASSAILRLKGNGSNAVFYLDKKSSANYGYILYKTNGVNKYYVGLLGNDSYKINYGGSSGLKGLEVKTTGDVAMSGNLEVADDLTVGSVTISGSEVQTTNTGNANMLPIAYGSVRSDGTLISGASSGNVSVSHPSVGYYAITITGVTYDYLNCAQSVTLLGDIGFVRTGSSSGKLLVYTYDVTGRDVDDKKNIMFSFVVYKP